MELQDNGANSEKVLEIQRDEMQPPMPTLANFAACN